MNVHTLLLHRAAKPALFALALLPFAHLLWGALANTLGANPAETLIRSTGDWTLRLLCLFAFFYALLHFLGFAWLDMGFDPAAIAKDIGKRPFILVGVTALVLMLPLAATSFNRAIKALGAARWQALHRAVYAVAGLALLHFFWMRAGKNDFAEVAVYAAIVGALLGWRVWHRLRARRSVRRSTA
jgi:sulfoxide reductase heme-binding subunit YedZ